MTGAHVHELVFAGDRCTGVRYEREGRIEELLAAEVVVCAGAVDSPSLLMRSGIGPAEELARAGVDVRADLPGVGRNLHDHLLMGVLWEAAQPVPPPEYNLAESSMFARSRPDALVPDLHFMFIHVPFHLPTYSVAEGSWTIAIGLVRPASRGTLRITSGDPAPSRSSTPVPDRARRPGRDGRRARAARELAAAHAFDAVARRGGAAGRERPRRGGPPGLRRATRRGPTTTRSAPAAWASAPTPSSTRSCVSAASTSLRVADASIMPDIVSANTNTAAMLIGEKAADLVKGSEPTPIDVGNARVGV